MNDLEIEKEETKSISQVINRFLENIDRKIFKSLTANLPFIPEEQVPDKNFMGYLLSLSNVKVGGNYGRKMMASRLKINNGNQTQFNVTRKNVLVS